MFFFAVSALLIFASASPAQCIAQVWDYGCAYSDCASPLNCTGTNFTVPHDGDYCVKVWAKCSPPSDCRYCQVCGIIYQGQTRIDPVAHRQDCGAGESDYVDDICEHSGYVSLEENVTYTLYACLTFCWPATSCDDCPGVGWAGVYDPASPGSEGCGP